MQGGVDVERLVTDNLYPYVSGELGRSACEARLGGFDDLDRIRSRLPSHFQPDGRKVIQACSSTRLLGAVLRHADVLDADWSTIHRRDHQTVKIPWVDD